MQTHHTQSADDRLSLLMLDDEPAVLRSLQRILRKQYQITCFTDGHEALAYLHHNAVDIIMSDMRMPNISGTEFLSQARRLSEHSMRVLLTGHSETRDSLEAINEGGIHALLNKPWDNEDIKHSLNLIARQYRENNQTQSGSEILNP